VRTRDIQGGFSPVDQCAATAEGGVVSSAFPDATAAGVEILELGGNAADAACAVGLALGVCEPQASGLGGQCMGILHVDGESIALDGSSRVPSLAHIEHYGDKAERKIGYRATTVPSTVASYGWLSEHYGSLPWHVVVEPAARIAREGYEITTLQNRIQARELGRFEAVPTRSGARYFLKEGVAAYDVGDVFRQPDLANTLEELSRRGAESFYTGEIAAQIDADMRANDGFLRADDLALTPWPIERRPLKRRYRRVTIHTMPPPGAGRILLLVMMMLEAVPSEFLADTDNAERYHFFAETFRKAFLQRLDRPYDPNTYSQVRQKTLLSRRFAHELSTSIAGVIDPTLPLEDLRDIEDDIDDLPLVSDRGETTHFSIMDAAGGVVSMTQSIELTYGSKAAADGLGFLYNNYMLALEADSPAHPYYLRPNAVPWSTASPAIVFRKGVPWIALGSPGSARIFSSVAQVLSHIVDGSRPLDVAVGAPRLHCSVGGKVSLEAGRMPPQVIEHLAETGYRIDERSDWSFYLGCVQATLRRSDGRGFQAAADPRRDGTAAGLCAPPTGGPRSDSDSAAQARERS
jgi:gamma-glutamyltranspeptidase/glutathione hydrolase